MFIYMTSIYTYRAIMERNAGIVYPCHDFNTSTVHRIWSSEMIKRFKELKHIILWDSIYHSISYYTNLYTLFTHIILTKKKKHWLALNYYLSLLSPKSL